MTNYFKLFWHIRKARKLSGRLNHAYDGLDCGRHMMQILRPEMAAAERDYELSVDRIRAERSEPLPYLLIMTVMFLWTLLKWLLIFAGAAFILFAPYLVVSP